MATDWVQWVCDELGGFEPSASERARIVRVIEEKGVRYAVQHMREYLLAQGSATADAALRSGGEK
jgi:hypothetical protein